MNLACPKPALLSPEFASMIDANIYESFPGNRRRSPERAPGASKGSSSY